MFETAVIFSAGIACLILLRVFTPKTRASRLYRHKSTGVTIRIEQGGKLPESSRDFERIDSSWVPYDMIVNTGCRLMVPFIQLFALYVIAHGHHSPGGGFQGGVIYGSAVILYAISMDLRSAVEQFGEKMTAFSQFIGCPALCRHRLPVPPAGGRIPQLQRPGGPFGSRSDHGPLHGILIVEVGVGMAVMAVMASLYYLLSSAGKFDEGL